MRRRRYLAVLGTLGIAGCAGRLSGGAAETPTLTPAPVGTGEPAGAPAADPPDTSAPEPTEPPLAAAPCDTPDYGDDVARVVCTGAADPDAPMVLEPSTTELDLPGELAVTLANGTDRSFRTNFYGWRLDKRVEGRWYRVAPGFVPQPATGIRPGGSYTWRVSMDGDAHNGGEPVPPGSGADGPTVGALGPGRYAVAVDGWFEGENHERQTAFVAAFDLRGEPLELTTTGYVESVTAAGDTLTARWTRNDGHDGDHREATYVVERLRVTGAPGARPVITEQVVRDGAFRSPLRDALALATRHDVREVRLAGKTAIYPPFGVDGRTVEYDGTAYRISTTEEAE